MDPYHLRFVLAGSLYCTFLFISRYRDYASFQRSYQRELYSEFLLSHVFVYPLCFFTLACDLRSA